MKAILFALAVVPALALADLSVNVNVRPGHPVIIGLPGHGEHAQRNRALQVAHQLTQSLVQLSVQADGVARQAHANGNQLRARRFQDLAYESRQLAQEVRQAVIRPLQMGAPLRRVSNNLDGLNYSFQDVRQALETIVLVPPVIRELAQRVAAQHRQLRSIL